MPIVDTHAFGETVKLGRFIIRFSFFALFALFDTEKNKKRYSTPTTPLRTRTSLRSLDKLGASSVVVPFLRGRFSLLSSRALFDGLLCFFFLYLSLKGEELFYSDDYSRAKSARDDAARSASFFEC